MKKTIGIVLGLLFSVVMVQAQDYVALDRFMKKYALNWSSGYRERVGDEEFKMIVQLGQPMPEFYFTRRLNSKKLQGKFIVLNFWATWCGGCRKLSCDIDTVMRRDPDVYEGVQVIGVDANETLADKGYKAEEWWKEKGIGYPTIGGKNADVCCASVYGGHPTVMLIDDQGIIRGRWDAWSPGVAEAVNLAIWALKVMPEQGILPELKTVKMYMEKGNVLKALYLLELMPEDKDNSVIRYKCLMKENSREAVAFFEKLKQKYEAGKSVDVWTCFPSEEYLEIMREIADCIYVSSANDLGILKNGIDAMQVVMNSRNEKSYTDYEKLGVLRVKYAEACKQQGTRMLKMAIKTAEKKNLDEAEVRRLQTKLKLYQE